MSLGDSFEHWRLQELDFTPRYRLRRMLASQRTEHEGRLALYEDAAAGLGEGDPYVAAVVRFGIRYEEAVLTWLDEVPV